MQADVNAQDNVGYTALHRAAHNGQLEMCKYLVEEAKIDIWIVCDNGLTAFQVAIKFGHAATANWLLEKTAINPPR